MLGNRIDINFEIKDIKVKYFVTKADAIIAVSNSKKKGLTQTKVRLQIRLATNVNIIILFIQTLQKPTSIQAKRKKKLFNDNVSSVELNKITIMTG